VLRYDERMNRYLEKWNPFLDMDGPFYVWLRKVVLCGVFLWAYLSSEYGDTMSMLLVGKYVLLLIQVVLFLLPRAIVNRYVMVIGTFLALVVVWWLVLHGGTFSVLLHSGRLSDTTQMLWPLLVWLPTNSRRIDPVTVILIAVVAAVIVLTSHVEPVYMVLQGLAVVWLCLGIRSGRLRREAHLQLQQAHRELEQATLESMRHAAMEERLRIARDMHDGVGHQLTSLIVQLQATEFAIGQDDKRAAQMTGEALATARESLQALRMTVRQFESTDDRLTLTAFRALVRSVEEKSQVTCALAMDVDMEGWSAQSVMVLYRVLQETLTNVIRHATATHVDVEIHTVETNVVLTVGDDGRIDDIAAIAHGFGMRTMRARCQAIGGEFTLSLNGAHGLKVQAVIPQRVEEDR
jgi:signal transduction histidine kinase